MFRLGIVESDWDCIMRMAASWHMDVLLGFFVA
jgi:hypothetical protein